MKGLESKDIPLKDLITFLSRGHYAIPDFQREFEWEPKAIDDLMRSIFRDYYIGSLLLWKEGDYFDSLSCEPISGYEGGQSAYTHIVLDGQQRLSAIYYAFFSPNKPAPTKKSRGFHFIRIDRFMTGDYQGAFEFQLRRMPVKKIPFETPQEQYENHCFPLSILGAKAGMVDIWFREYEKYWMQQKEQAQEAGDHRSDEYVQYQKYGDQFRAIIYDLLEHYQISYIELDQDIDFPKVCDIFTKINSTGIKLDIFDLLNAMLKPKGVLLKQLWRDARPDLESKTFRRMNIYILQVMSILCQGDCSPKYLPFLVPERQRRIRNDDGSFDHKIYIETADEFMLRWKQSTVAIKEALGLLSREYGAIVPKFIPYPAILPVFTALNMTADTLHPNTRLDAFDKVKHWYWASVFTRRYAHAVETTATHDYREVCSWMKGGPTPDMITQSVGDLRLHEFTQQGVAIYNGIINLIVLSEAKDWITGKDLDPEDIDDHHIVPKSWGRKHGLDKEIDTILNRTPLSSDTNRHVIKNRLPHEYLPELIARTPNGEVKVRDIFKSHLIPKEAFDILLRNPFERKDFYDFIEARERAIRSAIDERLLINPGG